MRTKVLLALSAALILVIGMTAIASNMGFKASLGMTTGGVGWVNWVGIPCTQVSRWDNSILDYENFSGARGQVPFVLTGGEGLQVTTNAVADWIVVGSHDPGLALNLTTGGVGWVNWTSVPYHTTAANAKDLKNEIGVTCTQV